MKKSKISIIIPVYNVCNYIDSSIASVIAQTYKNIEIILIDDGSTDGSSQNCDKWKKRDNRINCIHQKNAGVSEARNVGFNASSGEYILFIDGDDEISPDMCELLLNQLLKNEADVSYCGFLNIFENRVEKIIPEKKVLNKEEALIALASDISFFTAVWNKIFKRRILLDENGNFINFQKDIYIGEDALWLSMILKNVKAVTSVSKVLYNWKRRLDSATGGKSLIRTDLKHMSVLDAYKGMTIEMKNSVAYPLICKEYLGSCSDFAIQAYIEKNYSLVFNLIKRIKIDIKMLNGINIAFIIKLILCIILLQIHASVKLLIRLQRL